MGRSSRYAVAFVALSFCFVGATPRATPRHVRHGQTCLVLPPTPEMLCLINAERQAVGDGPLVYDRALGRVAQERSNDMIRRHYFSHFIPKVGKLGKVTLVWDLMNRQHVPYQVAGEDLAINNYSAAYQWSVVVAKTNQDLMNHPSHREIILSGEYTRFGLGMTTGMTRISVQVNGKPTWRWMRMTIVAEEFCA